MQGDSRWPRPSSTSSPSRSSLSSHLGSIPISAGLEVGLLHEEAKSLQTSSSIIIIFASLGNAYSSSSEPCKAEDEQPLAVLYRSKRPKIADQLGSRAVQTRKPRQPSSTDPTGPASKVLLLLLLLPARTRAS